MSFVCRCVYYSCDFFFRLFLFWQSNMLELCLHTTITIVVCITHSDIVLLPDISQMCTWNCKKNAHSPVSLWVFSLSSWNMKSFYFLRAGVCIFRKLGETDTFISNAYTPYLCIGFYILFFRITCIQWWGFYFYFSPKLFRCGIITRQQNARQTGIALFLSLSIHTQLSRGFAHTTHFTCHFYYHPAYNTINVAFTTHQTTCLISMEHTLIWKYHKIWFFFFWLLLLLSLCLKYVNFWWVFYKWRF